MKRFFVKVLTLILILGTLLWACGWAFEQTTTYRNVDINVGTSIFAQMPPKIELAVVGASHGQHAYDFSPYTQAAFNFSLAAQTPRYDLRMLREYGDRMEEGTVVISTVSPIFLYYTETEEAFQKKQPRYYRVLSPQNIIDCDLGRWCAGRFSPALLENTDDLLHAFLHPPELSKGLDASQDFCVEQDVIDQEIERIKRDHIAQIAENFPNPNPLMYDAFEEMAQLCQEKGWRLVWITPPYTQDYLDCFEDDFFPTFYACIEALSEKYDVPYWDYSHDAQFTGDYSLFRNIDHLNAKGQTIFTKMVYERLEALS